MKKHEWEIINNQKKHALAPISTKPEEQEEPVAHNKKRDTNNLNNFSNVSNV